MTGIVGGAEVSDPSVLGLARLATGPVGCAAPDGPDRPCPDLVDRVLGIEWSPDGVHGHLLFMIDEGPCCLLWVATPQRLSEVAGFGLPRWDTGLPYHSVDERIIANGWRCDDPDYHLVVDNFRVADIDTGVLALIEPGEPYPKWWEYVADRVRLEPRHPEVTN